MKDYQEVRQNLLDMLEELDDRLTRITADVKHEDQPLNADFSEQVVEMENNEVLDALGNAARIEVEKIRQAISRIDAGTYGVCQICGEAIKAERLAAVPFAKHCVRCEEKQTH